MTTTPRSRRERPAKPALSREWIIAETIRIIRQEGLDKATMRRVAQALDTGPASLYVYVSSTAELHAIVTDELISDLPAAAEGAWDDRIVALLQAYSDVLFSAPGLARSALVLRPMGPNSLVLFDSILALLLEGGVAAEPAAWGTDLLVHHATSVAAEHADTAGQDGDGNSAIASAVRGADAGRTPTVVAHSDALLSGTPNARFEWSLRALISGIAATSTPEPEHTGTSPLADRP